MTFSELVPPGVRHRHLQGTPPAREDALVGDGDAEVGRAAGSEQLAQHQPHRHMRIAASETPRSAHSNGVRRRPIPRSPEFVSSSYEQPPERGPDGGRERQRDDAGQGRPVHVSTRPKSASIAAETANATT